MDNGIQRLGLVGKTIKVGPSCSTILPESCDHDTQKYPPDTWFELSGIRGFNYPIVTPQSNQKFHSHFKEVHYLNSSAYKSSAKQEGR